MEEPVAKKLCEDTAKEYEKNKNTSQENESCFEFQPELTYDVLRIIFTYLNGKDLSTAAMVCRCWRDASANEIKTRGPVCLRRSLDKSSTTCDNYLGSNIVESLRIKPMLGIIFGGDVKNSVYESTEGLPTDCYCSQLPTSCDTVMLRTCDAISGDTELDKKDAMCVFLPSIPKVKVSIYPINTTQCCRSVTYLRYTRSKVQDWITNNAEFRHEKSKCLMVFSDFDGRSLAKRIMQSIKYKYPKQKLSLIGGVVKYIVYCQHTKKQSCCRQPSSVIVVTLSGPGIQTWSTIITSKCYKEEQIEKKLKSLKDKVQLKKFSIGFMFSCIARVAEKKMETQVFKKVFPEIPLVGGFGDGEFGENTIQDSPSDKGEPSRSYEYTTIFMILTYG